MLNAGVELKIKSPHDEKQPWTTWLPSVGAADGSSTPSVAVAVADADVVASAAYAGKAAAITAAMIVIVFIFFLV